MVSESLSLFSQFPFDGKFISSEPINEGLINTTYAAEFENGKYIIQKINTNVFKNPDELMSNIFDVTAFLDSAFLKAGADPGRGTLHFLKTNSGKPYFKDENGDCWRSYKYIDECYTLSGGCSGNEIFEAARAFGNFQSMLSAFPGAKLYETIKDFHNTPKRYEALEAAVSADPKGRVGSVTSELNFFESRKDELGTVTKMLETGELPMRVTHNDTKINNVLFDNKTNKAVCVIDLDTIMPGSLLYDFGDGVRTCAALANEDEPQSEKMGIDLNVYKEYVSGYLTGADKKLTAKEIELLPFSVKLMTLEVAIRFLTDYINGDTYFKTSYSDHNLVRTRAQIALVKDIEKKFSEMQKITEKVSGGA
ncbi:MAG: phosphotransferase enzyme family protein [Acutalibacteraceae bacterium]